MGHTDASRAYWDKTLFCEGKQHTKEPTLDQDLITYPENNFPAARAYNPWFAPGSAPVYSPCGLAAGQGQGDWPENGDTPPPGFKPGFDGRTLPQTTPTEWPIGSLQEVSWSIDANHGGGYAVRLCPLSSELTEECFQSNHLPFEGDSTWIQMHGDPSTRTEIRANRTTKGTHPAGS